MAKIIVELPEEYDLLSITIAGQTDGGFSAGCNIFDLEKGKHIGYSTKTGWVQAYDRKEQP